MASTKPKAKKNRVIGKPIFSAEFYEKLVEAYRQDPGNHSAAANAVGCARKTAKRGWEVGWKRHAWAPAISKVIEEEQTLARARAQKEWEAEEAELELRDQGGLPAVVEARREAYMDAQAEREKARQNAIRSRTDEGKMIEASRKLAMGSAGALLRTIEGTALLADRINKELKKQAQLPDKDFKLGAALSTIRKLPMALRDLANAQSQIMEMERLHMGEPGKIIGLQVEGTFDNAPIEDVLEEIEKAARDIKRAREKQAAEVDPGTVH